MLEVDLARGPKPVPAGIADQKKAVRSKREKPKAAQAAEAATPLADAAPRTEATSLDAPVWLEGEGLAAWHRLAPRLIQMRLLQLADVETFARYCRNFARWLKLQRALDTDGETYETASKHMDGKLLRANPAFMVSDRLERMLLATEDRFGMNPAERQRIMMGRAQRQPSDDPLGVGTAQPPRREDDPASAPAPAAAGIKSPIGALH